jgi:hypothetical protein
MRFPYTMFTVQTNFKPLLLGGGGIKSVSKGELRIARRKTVKIFVPITSKNSASGYKNLNSENFKKLAGYYME